ncbi:MAG: hypothetical protein JO244_13000 [Solirubrobacterales bacterium]|nr:hypothetical protein [Solirubrobacterales bacterium]
MILLECAQTKLVHYYLPAYPACALLAAWLVETLGRAGINLRHCPLGRIGLGTFAALGVGLTLALVHLSLIVLPRPIAWPCLAVAAVVAVGTSLGFRLFRGGHCSRAAWRLVGTWAVVLLILGVWLVPAAEPYRISTALGPRMAALVARERAEPITADYKEPSLIISLDRPVAPLLTWTWLIDQVGHYGKVVMALLPSELGQLRGEPRLEMQLSETVRGFNVSKGRVETLHLVVLRPATGSGVAPEARQETLVK